MDTLLYYAGLLVLIPSALLALYFGAVERLATSTGWGNFFRGFIQWLRWLQGWRLALLVVTLLFLLAAGSLIRPRPWGAGIIALAALAAIITIVRVSLHAGPSAGSTSLLFFWLLGPLLSLVISAMIIWRTVAPIEVVP